ncbi:5'-AMP-activated protein kinase subunit beta-2 isoform X2 [Phycodurus eques]|uniref:5'-AMP-activated protein kinase subunit beta-2 isoform X2 n=1 Tax=Phycodurus eques TaxID=693459 RepID=UPI002ACEF118|nr:5'-AMP-activated protein kinase subunit beta-2 isoform X2 [Phycodurus eques]
MGNTSDRVSADRHGGKAHRSDSGGGHKDHEPSSKMADSTDDPNIFSTRGLESKVSGEKEFPSDLDDLVKTVPQARPTVIRWAGGGKEVYIAGSFNNWSTKIPLNKSHNDFVAILDLPEGEHQYKFFVDGQWVHDPSEPVVTSQLGTINNLIQISVTIPRPTCERQHCATGHGNEYRSQRWEVMEQPQQRNKRVKICPAPLRARTGRINTCSNPRGISKRHPYSPLTFFRSYSTRTPIFHVTPPCCLNPTMLC